MNRTLIKRRLYVVAFGLALTSMILFGTLRSVVDAQSFIRGANPAAHSLNSAQGTGQDGSVGQGVNGGQGVGGGQVVGGGQGVGGQGGGANQSGPYDANPGVGSDQPGAGAGNANGMPGPGEVGNADNQNPPGQLPGGGDPNNGYECDNNPGIGDGNPAHTSCVGTGENAEAENAEAENAEAENAEAENAEAESAEGGEEPDKAPVCHATGSATNPYVFLVVPTNSAHFDPTKHPGDIFGPGIDGPEDCPGGAAEEENAEAENAEAENAEAENAEAENAGAVEIAQVEAASTEAQNGSSAVPSEEQTAAAPSGEQSSDDVAAISSLPDTGGPSVLVLGAAVLLVGLGLIVRRYRL